MRDNKPHGQWVVLQTLTHLPPFGQTARTVADHGSSKLSHSGVRTRLKELEQMGLVVGSKGQGRKYRIYVVTELGWMLMGDFVDGEAILRSMRNACATLEAQRATELAPIKEKWDHIIRNRMTMIASVTIKN